MVKANKQTKIGITKTENRVKPTTKLFRTHYDTEILHQKHGSYTIDNLNWICGLKNAYTHLHMMR